MCHVGALVLLGNDIFEAQRLFIENEQRVEEAAQRFGEKENVWKTVELVVSLSVRERESESERMGKGRSESTVEC